MWEGSIDALTDEQELKREVEVDNSVGGSVRVDGHTIYILNGRIILFVLLVRKHGCVIFVHTHSVVASRHKLFVVNERPVNVNGIKSKIVLFIRLNLKIHVSNICVLHEWRHRVEGLKKIRTNLRSSEMYEIGELLVSVFIVIINVGNKEVCESVVKLWAVCEAYNSIYLTCLCHNINV